MSSYWSKRQNQLYKSMEKDESALKERLSSFYESEYSSLDKEIAAYYQKYGTNNVIEYRTLMQTLSAEDVKLLIEKTDEFTSKYPQYAHLVPVRNSIYKLNRLEGLQYSVVMQQLKIGAVDIDEVTKHLDKQALRGLNAAMETLGFGKNFYSEGADIIKQFVDVDWSNGLNFSSRIWGNTEKLANYLNTDIAQGFARGDSYEKLTARLRTRFENVSRNDAYRLIYTEGTFVMAESTMQPFTEDFEKYKVSTAGDGKVCSICSGIARNEYNIKDRKAGVNFPPFHGWCRCTFEIVVDDWDKWLDDYEKKHGRNGYHLKDVFKSDTIDKRAEIPKTVIDRIKSFDLPDFTVERNEKLRQAMVNILEKVNGTVENTECAYYYDMRMKFLKWEMGVPGASSVNLYKPPFDYIALHNHPSGGTFSIGDIRLFCLNKNMQCLIVVGNNGNQYLIKKCSNFSAAGLIDSYYNYSVSLSKQNISTKDALLMCSDYIEKGAQKYGYEFRKIIP